MVYLRFMPCFQFFLVLLCHLLILGPDFCHDLSQILAFRSVDIHVDSRLGNLVTKLDNFLKKEKKVDRKSLLLFTLPNCFQVYRRLLNSFSFYRLT